MMSREVISMISGVLTMLGSADAHAQPAEDLLEVQWISEGGADRTYDDTVFLEGPFEASIDAENIKKAFTISGLVVPDGGNRPGRMDPRPRVFHDNAVIKFAGLEAGAASPRLRKDWMLSHHINVGQGNATLLEFSCGLVLVDAGGQTSQLIDGSRRLVGYLEKVFKRRPDLNRTINTIFLTHPHKDHTEGVAALLAASPAIAIGGVVANGRTNGSGWVKQRSLIDFANARGIAVAIVANDTIARSDGRTDQTIDAVSCAVVDPEIRVLWGSDNGSSSWGHEANNNSVVVRVDFGESSFLFTGDMEETAQDEFVGSYIRNPDIIDADVYQVGHHGSKNGTTAALLRVMTPEIAVIGAGDPGAEEPDTFAAFNFAHPNRVAIELLSDPRFGVTMARPPVWVAVGIKGKAPNGSRPPTYERVILTKAIFSTGWDGDLVIAASASGKKEVQVH